MSKQSPDDANPSFSNAYERMLIAIVLGAYPSDQRLPGERDLAAELGTSRPTLREALRKLSTIGLVHSRRGSGVVVQPLDRWSFDVLPYYVATGARRTAGGLRELLIDLLSLRRAMVLSTVRSAAPRLQPGSLDKARVLASQAWEARSELKTFVRRDADVARELAVSGRVLPSLWLLNSLHLAYTTVVGRLTPTDPVPADYLEVHVRVATALEGNDADAACDALGDLMMRLDEQLLAGQ